MQASYAQKAIQLITVDESGKYVLHRDGLEFIGKIPAPIAVVSVAGLYRTGKSYLLNRMLLNRSNGFGVGPTVNPCTKGLWCWGTPIKGSTADGEKVNVIIIDTEGIGALDQDQTHDTRIFTLAVLASSSFIYNSVGSIDENALQNLSLVVNLTKSIQLASNPTEDQQDDPEELSAYFPSFYWVVRDFALQLIDAEGDQITPKEYLERALAPQKGFSDDVEEKNRIRRLLTTFFADRECLTLVRPLVDQNKLQHLDKLEFDELRPEFVDQVIHFRKRILNRMKPKTLKNKMLDGQMYLCLLESYVSAINEGAVPNIQNAWTYMCKEHCIKVFEDSERFFEEELTHNVKLPCPEKQFIDFCEDILEKSCEKYENEAIGDQVKLGIRELRVKLKNKVKKVQTQNEKESQIYLRNFFMKSYSVITKKLKINEFKTFQDYMKNLGNFYINLLQNEPFLPRKQLTYLELIKKAIPNGAEHFLKCAKNDHDKIVCLAEEKQKMYEKDFDDLKKELSLKTEESRQKIMQLDRDYAELSHDYNDLKKKAEKNTLMLVQKHESLEKSLKQKIEEFNNKEIEYSKQISELQQTVQEINSEKNIIKGDWEKERAISQFKLQQLASEIEVLKKKEMNYEVQLANAEMQKKDMENQLYEKYEQSKLRKENQCRLIKEKLAQNEEKFTALEQDFQTLKAETNEKHHEYRESLNKKNQELSELRQLHSAEKNKINELMVEEMQSKESDLVNARQKINCLEKQVKKIQQNFVKTESTYTSQIAVLNQTIDFIKQEQEQKKSQYEQEKQYYQKQIQKLEEEQQENNIESQKMSVCVERYETKMKQIKIQYDAQIRKASGQYEQIQKKLNEKDLELKILKSNYSKTQADYEATITDLESKLKQRVGQKDEEIRLALIDAKQKQKSQNNQIQQLLEEIQELKEQQLREQREQHEKSQQIVKQLKNYYQIERERLEERLTNQKQINQRKLESMQEQYEEKIRQEVAGLEDEIQQIRGEYINMEESLRNVISSLQHENQMKTKSLENLERVNGEYRDKFENRESQNSKNMQKIRKQLHIQKQYLQKKVEQLQTTVRGLEKELTFTQSQREQSQKLLQIKDKNIQEINEELVQTRTKSEKQRDESKNKLSELKQRLQEEKIQSQKKIAVLEEQKKHAEERADEYEKSVDNIQQITEEKIKKIKEDQSYEMKQAERKSQEIIENLQKKLQNHKKTSKQNELALQRNVSSLEKQLAISSEKLANYAEKLTYFESKQTIEAENLNDQLSSIKRNFKKEKQLFIEQIETEKRERQAIEMEKNTINANYQQDKMLWENKYKFLEESHRKSKQEYEETKNKLETALQTYRKNRTSEKLAGQNHHAEQILKLEKNYWNQIQQINENNSKKEAEFEKTIKKLEFENRELIEKLALEQQDTKNNRGTLDRKIKTLQQNEKRLMGEVEKFKTSKQNEQNQKVTKIEKEKEILKQKLQDREQKHKQVQKLKQGMYFDYEKDKAKWNAERQQILTQKNELLEKLTKSDKQLDKIRKQLEKLKIEKKCNKNNMQSMARYSNISSIQRGGFGRSSFEDSILKENNTSQISSDTSFFFKNQ